MRTKIEGMDNEIGTWDNLITFSDLEPPPGGWGDLRRTISAAGGNISTVSPLRVLILDCSGEGGEAPEVKRLVTDLKVLNDNWGEGSRLEGRAKAGTQ